MSTRKCTKGLLDYLKFDLHSRCICDRDLTGQVVIVTGANSGIGYETCAVLADKGAKIIMACRNRERAEEAMGRLKSQNAQRDLIVEIIDVSNMQSVRDFARRINAGYHVINMLINNAGVIADPDVTSEGFEIHFATNHLGHFLLTNLLLEKLEKAEDARVINVSSMIHKMGQYCPEKFKKAFGPNFIAYANSKLCNILFTKELDRRVKGTSVSTFSLHPGVVATSLYRHAENSTETRFMHFAANSFGKPFFKTSKQGAQTIVHAALNKDMPVHSGAYLVECAVASPSRAATNAENARKLWEISAEYTGIAEA